MKDRRSKRMKVAILKSSDFGVLEKCGVLKRRNRVDVLHGLPM